MRRPLRPAFRPAARPARPCPTPARASASSSSSSPRVLGWPVGFENEYALGAKLAAGSYGTVYSGTHRASGDRVAIKVLPKRASAAAAAPGRLPIDSLQQLQRLQREVDLMMKVAPCQNVGTVNGLFEDEAAAYVVLRFIDGGDLEGLLDARAQPLTERESAVIAFEILKVVAACHAAGVVHGDIKPANIMLAGAPSRAALGGVWKKPFVALSDFGLARACAAGDTVRGTRGTPVFMAPECFMGEYGQPADVYAVGVTLYTMLSRRYVYWPTRAEVMKLTPRAVRARVLSSDAVFDGSAPPFADLSADVRDLLASLLARAPDDRPPAVAALQHAWFAAQLPPDVPVDGPPPSLAHVLAHKSMSNCATCTLTVCPLSGGGGEAPSPFARIVDDASAVEVGGVAPPDVDG